MGGQVLLATVAEDRWAAEYPVLLPPEPLALAWLPGERPEAHSEWDERERR
jgi:hypothetical protein